MHRNRDIFELEAQLCQVLSNPKRLEILYTLSERELPAGEIARVTDVSMPNLSQHLGMLKQFGLVEARKVGLHMYYRLGSDLIMDVCLRVRKMVAEQLARQSEILAMATAEPGPGNTNQPK